MNFGFVLLHLAVDSPHKHVRQATNDIIKELTVWDPHLTTTTVREATAAFLSGDVAVTPKKHGRLAAVLLSAVAYNEDAELEVKERLVTDLAVVAHHMVVCEFLPSLYWKTC
jgi:hypothetical protein